VTSLAGGLALAAGVADEPARRPLLRLVASPGEPGTLPGAGALPGGAP
jgi:hypothetical protein